MDIADLLVYTLENSASDLHITVNLPPSVRIHGEIEQINFPPMTREQTREIVYSIMNDRQRAKFEEYNDIDFSLDFGSKGCFCVNAFMGREGIGAVLRVIPSQIKSVDELCLPNVISKMAEFERGLVLVSGLFGLGFSFTLAALIDQLNATRQAF